MGPWPLRNTYLQNTPQKKRIMDLDMTRKIYLHNTPQKTRIMECHGPCGPPSWSLVPGLWLLVPGPWPRASGRLGPWSLVPLSLAPGPWAPGL